MNWTYLHPWLLSLIVASTATLINAVVAIPLSYFLARKRFAGRWLLEAFIVLPLVLPPTVIGYLLMFLLGTHGPYAAITGDTALFSLKAAICGSSVVSFPLLVLPTRAAFAGIAREYDEEARVAGISRFQRFLHIAMPLARGGILSGLLLGFARALGEFGATLMLISTGEQTRTLPIQIYLDAGSTGNFASAWPAVLALGMTSVGVIVLANRLGWLERDK